MIIDRPTFEQIPALRSLWKEAFGDTDAFLDDFFRTAFSPSRCRCVCVGDEPVAALYWFDCQYEGQRIAYLYAIATAKAHRGKGFFRALMEDTHCHLRASGYEASILVPGTPSLFELYAKIGYGSTVYVKELSCSASPRALSLREVDVSEYASLRRKYLPLGGVLQEGENMAFLETQARFFAGDGLVLAARVGARVLVGIELLGDTSRAANVVTALGCEKGRFRVAGNERPFAMFCSFGEVPTPQYFGLAFD